eukprot:symbB.v1.2.040129.t1/scaffold7012.1/size13871/1
MLPRNLVYGLALYQPEVELPFKARRPETQSVAEDMATWLKAQSALVLEGDVSRRESEAQPEAPKAGGNQGEVAHSGKPGGLNRSGDSFASELPALIFTASGMFHPG